jgi:hypothetical protein
MMSRIEAHPDAAIFPMMSADELADLAVDIKENGQRFPIIIGPYEGREVIVDGRNRYEACEIAGVDPQFEKLNGHDPKAFILSVNIKRRHMNAGQRAMATAMIYPKPQNGGARKKGSPMAATGDGSFSLTSLSHARSVLAFSPALAASVLSGTKTLDAAYHESRLGEGNIKNEATRLRALRDERPDLAARVNDAELTLDDAIAMAKSEAEAAKQRRWAATKNLVEGVQLLDRSTDTAADLLNEYDPAVAQQMGETITPERLARVAQFASALAQHLAERTTS